jgi:hypothetical protein
VAAQRPRSNYQPKRNYNKPWQRPQTAGTRPEENKKNSKDEMTDKLKETTRKKASDIVSRRKQIRPVINKKTTETEKQLEPKSGDIKVSSKQIGGNPPIRKAPTHVKNRKSEIGRPKEVFVEDLDDQFEEIEKETPEPIPQTHSKQVAKPKSAAGMRKLNSHEMKTPGLSLGLSQVDKEYEPRNLDPKESPLLLESTKDETKPVPVESKRNSKASRMIGDIKKRMKDKGGKSMESPAPFTDENSGITCSNGSTHDDAVITTGHVDEVESIKRTYTSNEEEEKLDQFNLSGRSKESSQKSSELVDIDEDMEESEVFHAFSYHDKNFDDDEDLLKTPFGDIGLDEIDEREEMFDDEEAQNKHMLKLRIRDLEKQITEKWEELKKEQSDPEVAKK